ncbi:MAG TPA: Crp/Fnr family transcriptional regulator [Acetobacteraceae bacterium]|nr:Crp/Fnr family transcriptional regulator [Acetobacteraceae bacterium]
MTQLNTAAIDRGEALGWLARHPILRPLDRASLEGLLGFAQLRILRARGRLFAAGDAGSALYLILSGWMKLTRQGPAGRDIVLEIVGPGSLFGELAVLCGSPRAADAVALSACRVLAIDGRALISALRAHPDALLAVVRLLGERLARTTSQMEDGLMSAEPRLARALLRLAALDPKPGRTGLTIDLGLSQSDLGELTGLARESINKLLGGWRDAGWIELAGRTLTLIDAAALRAVADMEALAR